MKVNYRKKKEKKKEIQYRIEILLVKSIDNNQLSAPNDLTFKNFYYY